MLHSLLLCFAQADRLDDIIRSSREIHSFAAVFELTSTLEVDKTRLCIDFQAPAQVRVQRTCGPKLSTTWCVDGTLAIVSNEGDKPIHGRFDSGAVFEAIAPLEKTLHDTFPNAAPRPALGAAVGMGWFFDTKNQKANFAVESDLREQSATPLGWLLTLQQKQAVAREDGELLRFETDDRFHIAVSRQSGFLQEFSGTSPKGELHLALISLELNKPIDAARFALPSGPFAGTDISADLSRGIRVIGQQSLRSRIYAAVAGENSAPPYDDAMRAKIAAVFQPFYDRTVPETLATWFEKSRKLTAGVAERIAGMRKNGKSAQEIDQVLVKETGYLNKQLDDMEQGFLTRLAAPSTAKSLPHTAELLEQEKRAVSEAFRTQVRAPIVKAFEQATAK